MSLSSANIQLIEVPCPLCQSTQWKAIATIRDWTYDLGGPFQAVRCVECNHRYLNPRPTDETMLHCYPANYGPHHGDANPDTGNHLSTVVPIQQTVTAKKRFPFLRMLWRSWLDNRSTWIPTENAIQNTGPRKAIEIGCADGWFCEQLAQSGWNVQGIEPVASAAKRAESRGIQVHVGTVRDVFVPSESIDFVAAWMVLEHVSNPVETIQQISKWVRPGGLFAFSVPNAASFDAYLFASHWSGYDGGRHLQFYTPRSLERLLDKGHFRTEKLIHQNTIQPIIGSVGSLLSSIWPTSSISKKLGLLYMTEIGFRTRVLCSPLANLLAGLYLSSRITVVARKQI